jgi:protein-S-isoprenylcysteine O-methyltransferase Ste14
MAATALTLDLVFLFAGFGGRTLLQWRRTRDTGWRLGRPHGRAELVARALLVGSAALLGVAVALAFAGPPPGATAVAIAGVVVSASAIVLVVAAQLHMGASWRIGLDPGERTELVRSGLYRSIRNPIYTGMVAFAVGQALMLPGAWTAAALVAMVVGVEVQVRAVEEPYLRSVHGRAFAQWATVTGRFVPRLGGS